MGDAQEDALLAHPLSLLRRETCAQLFEEGVYQGLPTALGLRHVRELTIVHVHHP